MLESRFDQFAPSMDGVRRDPHGARGRAILAAHPEIRALMRRDPRTAWWFAATACVQTGLAACAAQIGLWGTIVLAYCVGAFCALALWTLLHETTHDLVFRKASSNRTLGLLGSLPIGMPVAAAFRKFHRAHHRHLGNPAYDADLARDWERRVVRASAVRKGLWLGANALVQSARVSTMRQVGLVDRRWLANLAVQLAFDAAIVALWGWTALAYLLLSNVFAFGLHPLGGRIIQEHFEFARGQETGSYYGIANRVLFNAGYHVEHHDLVGVPWSALPQVRATAAPFYADLHAHRSWTRLVLRFLGDRSIGLHGRVVRRTAEQP